jgi:predicted nucleic acid-binding Zn ribbon protein
MMMNDPVKVLYVYRCAACGHRDELHLPDDTHDGEATVCVACGAPVRIEWDGGVTFEA